MRSSAWIELLRLIPSEQRHQLMLMTANGIEIIIQAIYRTEPDYLVLRGRMGGSTEAGKVLFIPYDQIQYLGFREEVKEAQVNAMFDDRESAAQTAPQVEETLAAVGGAAEPAMPFPEEASASPGLRGPEGRPSIPNKAALLERLRRLRAGQGISPPPGN